MPASRRETLFGLLAVACPLPASAAVQPIDAARAYEAATGGRIGYWARNLSSGVTMGWRERQRFAMCSTFKMSLAALVLRRIDRGQDRLDAPIRFGAADVPDWHAPVARAALARGVLDVAAMASGAVEQSDNSCANLLLARVGGPAALTSFWRETGDTESRLDHHEPLLNRTPPGGVEDTTTPEAMAKTTRRLLLGDVLASASRERLKTWLISSVTGRNRLRAGLPTGWIAGDKTGNNGADAACDVMIAWPPGGGGPIVVCAYTRGGTPDEQAFRTVFAAIGREAAIRLG